MSWIWDGVLGSIGWDGDGGRLTSCWSLGGEWSRVTLVDIYRMGCGGCNVNYTQAVSISSAHRQASSIQMSMNII